MEPNSCRNLREQQTDWDITKGGLWTLRGPTVVCKLSPPLLEEEMAMVVAELEPHCSLLLNPIEEEETPPEKVTLLSAAPSPPPRTRTTFCALIIPGNDWEFAIDECTQQAAAVSIFPKIQSKRSIPPPIQSFKPSFPKAQHTHSFYYFFLSGHQPNPHKNLPIFIFF
jgi:hypothetical protein